MRLLHAVVWTKRHLSGALAVPELPSLLPLLRPDDVFIDVGAHAGGWTVPVSRALTAGHVYAFEALPHYAGVLKMTVAFLRRRNVTVVAGAIADRPGVVPMVWKDAEGRRLTGMTHIGRPGERGDAVPVEAFTLDDYCARQPQRRISLVKCDVEGAELLVLRGAVSIIDRWRPLVFCELYEDYCAKYGYHASDVFEFFGARRYRPWTIERGTFHSLDPARYGGRGDVLFAPSEDVRIRPCD